MHGNGRPLGMRKRMQLLVAVVLLAWATQTLLHQWGFGAEVPQEPAAAEKFVPGTARFAAGATFELRGEAAIIGAEVRLRQIGRWSDADAQVFAPVADLVVVRIDHGSPFRQVTVEQVRGILHDAGVNLAVVKFAGPVSCTVTRRDANYDEQTALRLWAEARESAPDAGAEIDAAHDAAAAVAAPRPSEPARVASAAASPTPAAAEQPPTKTLRQLLLEDLSVRLRLPPDQLEVSFNPQDEKLLRLSSPLFQFNIEPRQVRDLGQVSWNVLIVTGSGSQKGVVTADARAWQKQIVVTSPLAYHQVIRPEDVTEKRVLADRLAAEPLLAMPQVVGQEAARDLPVGTVLGARSVDPVPLVKPGQLVTVTLESGTVRIKTVCRSLEEGAYGQTVRVRNETTRDVFEVVMTGPQQGSMGPLQASPRAVAAR